MYRTVVLDAAERIFGRDGFHGTKMQDVAREAGISLNTLYGTYPSKREVFEALHEARGSEFMEQIEAALAAPGDARESLGRGVVAFVDYLIGHPDFFRIDLREGRSWAIGDAEASPAFRAGIETWTELVRRGVSEGVFHDEDPAVMAVTTFGLMQIQLAAWLAKRKPPELDQIARHITTAIERTLCIPDKPAR
ncbi:MAG: hypothetical protein CL908_23660 [Deltaproteobacteria bacterium]|nr:hypothetical protein [Deltaproteobacteria bacterium]